MTTATGEYAHLPPQFSALSIADAAPGDGLAAENNGVGAPPPPRKPWGGPGGRAPAAASLAEDPRPSPRPAASSRGGSHGGKKTPQQRSHETAAMVAPVPSSSPESESSGDPISPAADPRRRQQVEKGAWEEQRRSSEPAAAAAPPVGNSNPRAARPPLLPVPRQQQGRPPQNGRRGRAPYHHNNGDYGGNGGNPQQRRSRQQWNASFAHQQPAQIVNGSFYMNQPMMGFPNFTPDWGFGAMPMLQWGPNPTPHLPPPYIGAIAAPVGPRFPEVFSYPAPPLSPIPPPPPPAGWNPPWFVAPLPGPPEAALQSQAQAPAGNIPREGEDVSAKLRRQIEYYFSDENLMKDIYLRSCMDNQGWVSIQTIANFPRVRSLTRDVGLVLGALQTSDTVEILVDKMRRKGEWSKWIIQQQLPDANRNAPEG